MKVRMDDRIICVSVVNCYTRECVVFFSRASCRDIKKRAIKCRASCTARNYCSIEKNLSFSQMNISVKRKITNV